MGLFVPAAGDFKWQLASFGTARPSNTFMSAITPGTAPTMGSWVNLITAGNMTQDAYGIMICINGGSTSATTRNVLVDIGVDNAGGTSYRVLIPYLMGGHAASYTAGGGVWYYFPLFIPAGSALAARALGDVTTAIRVGAIVYGQPRRPDAVRVGSKVVSFGETAASATGTAITLGAASEGAWTQVGSATDRALWWWQAGYTCVDTTMTAQAIHLDVGSGNATTKKILVQDLMLSVTTAEAINNLPRTAGCIGNVASGDLIYMRGQSSATADTTTSVMAWGLG